MRAGAASASLWMTIKAFGKGGDGEGQEKDPHALLLPVREEQAVDRPAR